MSKITFAKFNQQDIPLFRKWAETPEVKNTWFVIKKADEYIKENLESGGRSYVYSFVILINDKPIGYIQGCDLAAYGEQAADPKVYINEPNGTFGIDLFIGEPDYIGKGYGAKIVHQFMEFLKKNHNANRFLIDPNVKNVRAVKCYQKAGFKVIREEDDFDGDGRIYVMEKTI